MTAHEVPRVHDYDVPVLVTSLGLLQPGSSQQNNEFNKNWTWLRPYIDSYKTILRIAADTNVEKPIIKSCIIYLISHGVVTMTPVLRFSHPYRATPEFCQLFDDHELQESCLTYITRDSDAEEPYLSDVFEVFSSLQKSRSLRELCHKYTSSKAEEGPGFDIRRLVIFAQLRGLIKCLKIYPVYFPNPAQPGRLGFSWETLPGIRRFFNGSLCTEEICTLAKIYHPHLEKLIEDDPCVSVIWK